jgi:hypothetical protein
VIDQKTLDDCKSIGEVCDELLVRLRNTEVRFISIQRDQDAMLVKKSRNDFKRMTTIDPRQLKDVEKGNSRPLTTELAPGKRGSRVGWFTCGSVGCGCHSSGGGDPFPKECSMICFRLTLLSKEHATLIAGFLVGFVILGIELYLIGGGKKENLSLDVIIEVFLNQFCLLVLLSRFEEIDVIQQLEREVKELKKAEENVEKQRKKMHEFWSEAQQLTELWLYRTVPRLDLYKEVHSLLEDPPAEELTKWLALANQELEALESKLGDLDGWRNEGAIGLEDKKKFGKLLNDLCQEQEFDQISKKLDNVLKTQMNFLKDSKPQASPNATASAIGDQATDFGGLSDFGGLANFQNFGK